MKPSSRHRQTDSLPHPFLHLTSSFVALLPNRRRHHCTPITPILTPRKRRKPIITASTTPRRSRHTTASLYTKRNTRAPPTPVLPSYRRPSVLKKTAGSATNSGAALLSVVFDTKQNWEVLPRDPGRCCHDGANVCVTGWENRCLRRRPCSHLTSYITVMMMVVVVGPK